MHSPFVFDLLTKCLYKKTHLKGLDRLNAYRKKLLKNGKIIAVTDFGAGSKIFKSNQRKVSDIARYAGVSKKRSRLLLRLSNYFEFNNSLEIGTSLGISTSAISLGNPNSNIITLEGCPETAKIAQNMFDDFGLRNITMKVGDFKHSYPKALENQTIDFIYFDGNHSRKATLDYFETCLPYLHNDSVLLFDDIHWSKEMESAWKEIKEHPQVQVTIDTYQWGFVFLRKQQHKEHFTIRV